MDRKIEKNKKNLTKPRQSTRERLLEVATDLFALKGYEGTSTKEICEKARANISALHYHFETKEKLFLTIIHRFGEESLGSALRILNVPSNLMEFQTRLEMFLTEVMELCLANRNLVLLVQSESEAAHSRSHDVVKATFIKMFEALYVFFEESIKKKILREKVDPHQAAGLIFSILSQGIRGESFCKQYFNRSLHCPDYRKKWIQSTLDIVFHGVYRGFND